VIDGRSILLIVAWQLRRIQEYIDRKITEPSMSTACKEPDMIDMKAEVIVIAVTDVERAKRFYGSLGWRLDADFPAGDSFRVVQFTPPGSPCSIHFGVGVTAAAAGSSCVYLVVTDIVKAHAELVAHSVQVSEVSHRVALGKPNVAGPHPQRQSYASFATFNDPDGNTWVLQEVTARLPGRVDSSDTTYSSSGELEAALSRAATAHGEHEKRTGGQRDEAWPRWYADYMVSEQGGKPLPE
jgi:catechol 2,3-dioxygenase-like lactoylglutathione lyase family enzyme